MGDAIFNHGGVVWLNWHRIKGLNPARAGSTWLPTRERPNLQCSSNCPRFYYNLFYSNTYPDWGIWKLAGSANNWGPRHSISAVKQYKVLVFSARLNPFIVKGRRRVWSRNRLDGVPTAKWEYRPLGAVRRLCNFFPTLGRGVFHFRCNKFYQDNFKHAAIGYAPRPDTLICLVSLNYNYPAITRPPCFSRGYHHAFN